MFGWVFGAGVGEVGVMRAAAVAVVGLLALAGCSSGGEVVAPGVDEVGDTAQPALSAPADPVEVASRIEGCELPEGVVLGEVDDLGNRSVECEWVDGDGIVHAWADVVTFPAELDARDAAPHMLETAQPDIETVVTGGGFVVRVTDTTMRTVDTAEVAEQVGGEVADTTPPAAATEATA